LIQAHNFYFSFLSNTAERRFRYQWSLVLDLARRILFGSVLGGGHFPKCRLIILNPLGTSFTSK
jgi:hypothetical protein